MDIDNSIKNIFDHLYKADSESKVERIIGRFPEIFSKSENWKPLGNNEGNFGVIENQQATPIASLIEKITNSIDAILMKKCFENGKNPKSLEAPKSMHDAVEEFFPNNKNWDLSSHLRKQAEEIQIIADGLRRDTSLIIYDNGEGQHPREFERTFLSLLAGNKKDIQFVQGQYNMGGSGAIVWCGKKRYQLLGSRRWDKTGDFGFTLIREHPFPKEEQAIKKNTWYEYLVVNGEIPCFPIDELDLGLFGRKFKTGTIIKLYSYQMSGVHSGAITHDLNQSINEYLFEPALPIYTVDNKARYPKDKVLELPLYGLKRRLEAEREEYIETYKSIYVTDNELFGSALITFYVFKTRSKDKSVKKTREDIARRYFKNNMSVLFSLNGQVQGHYTQEFITRSLKMNLLKNHLLIHIDCTKMKYHFRKELFMASRDRLKNGDETYALRRFLSDRLKKSDLSQIEKQRKNAISVESGDTRELLKEFTKEIPKDSELLKLLDDAFKLDLPENREKKSKPKKAPKKSETEPEPFQGKRFPSFFNLKMKNDGETPVAHLPRGGEKILHFETDIENYYFDRIEEPGEIKIAILNYKANTSEGGSEHGKPKQIEDLLNVDISSPNDGVIKVALGPKKDTIVGDLAQLKVTLNGQGPTFEEIFWVKFSDPEKPREKPKKKKEDELPNIGLPDFTLVYEKLDDDIGPYKTWDDLAESGFEFTFDRIMDTLMDGDKLERIFINMDSSVLMNYKSKIKHISEEQKEVADKRYISTVYFHTLFLYTITKKRRYQLQQEKDNETVDRDITEYIRDLFESYYSEFLLNFGMEQLMDSLGG